MNLFFSCEFCEVFFTSIQMHESRMVSKHEYSSQRYLSTSKTYYWNVCDDVFSSPNSLQNHISYKHLENFVGAPRNAQETLLRHLYACDVCGKQSESSQLLRVHMEIILFLVKKILMNWHKEIFMNVTQSCFTRPILWLRMKKNPQILFHWTMLTKLLFHLKNKQVLHIFSETTLLP